MTVLSFSASEPRRRATARLVLTLLCGTIAAALLAGRQEVTSALPLLIVCGFYFALYRGGKLVEPAACARSTDSGLAPGVGLRSLLATLGTRDRGARSGNADDDDSFSRLEIMAAAERERALPRRARSRA